MTFGERVKQARLAKGLTQSQLAKCAGYAGATSIASLETQGRCNAAAEKNRKSLQSARHRPEHFARVGEN